MMGWRAVTEWPEAVGPRVARRARAVRCVEGALLVEVEGSAWLHELSLLKRDLARRLNERLGQPHVREIQLVITRGGIRR
jgi:predicted nucleic acid-binding Zn ribbon protein